MTLFSLVTPESESRPPDNFANNQPVIEFPQWSDWIWHDGQLVRLNLDDQSIVEVCCDRLILTTHLQSLEDIKQDYLKLAQTAKKSRHNELMRGVKDKDEQIQWVKNQLESLDGENPQKSPPNSNGGNSEIIHLDLEEIRRDGGTQPRAKIDLQHIKRLEEQMEDGQEIEPVVVFYDGESYWLADGFHRWNAHRNQQEPTIRAIVHQGSRRDAVLYSVGANADHKPALPRSRADKQRAVLTLLHDPEWKQWSDRAIAKMCKVHHQMVGRLRSSLDDHPVTKSSTDTLITAKSSSNKTSQSLTGELSSDQTDQSLNAESSSDDVRTYRTKHGTIATMNTANIGKTQEKEMKDTTIEVNTDDILIAFSSNLENFSDEQLQFIGRTIAALPPERLQLILDN